MPIDATDGVQDDVQVDDRHGHSLAHDTQQDEQIGHQDGGEDLEEVLDPQVDHHEPPEVRDGVALVGVGHQADRVEGRDREAGVEEQPRHVDPGLVPQGTPEPAEQHERPEEQTQRQQHLPEAPEVQVLPALHPDQVQGRRQPSVQVHQLTDHGAEDDHGQGTQQAVREPGLTARLAAGDDRCEEQAGGQERRRRPEDGELDVPGADQVVRQPPAQVEAEEAGEVGAVVLARRPDHRLDDEEQTDDEEEVGAGTLRRCHRHVVGWPERDGVGLAAAPPHPFTPTAERGEQHADAGEQDDQGQHAPDHDVGGHRVGHQVFRWPVVGVRVVLVRSQRRPCPGRPGEVGGELLDLLRVGDRIGQQALGRAVRPEVRRVVLDELVEGPRLDVGHRDRVRLGVVPVGLEVRDDLLACGVRRAAAVLAGGDLGRTMQVVGGEVGPEVGAVAEDRPVLHQALAQEQRLTVPDVVAGVDDPAVRGTDLSGDRRVGGVRPVAEEAEHSHAEQQDEHGDLHPDPRDECVTVGGVEAGKWRRDSHRCSRRWGGSTGPAPPEQRPRVRCGTVTPCRSCR